MKQENQVEGVDYKMCDNCRHPIPVGVFSNHTLACIRRNWYCEACGNVVEKTQKDQHIKDLHTLVLCECGQELETRLLEFHKASECPKRIVRCQYCPLEMPYVERYEHEKKCGSQTDRCEFCHKYVKKQDLAVHVVDCQKPKAIPELNQYYHPPQFPQNKRQGEDVLLCPMCDTPFVHYDDLEVHVLTAHSDDSKTQDMDEEIKSVEDKPPEEVQPQEPVQTWEEIKQDEMKE